MSETILPKLAIFPRLVEGYKRVRILQQSFRETKNAITTLFSDDSTRTLVTDIIEQEVANLRPSNRPGTDNNLVVDIGHHVKSLAISPEPVQQAFDQQGDITFVACGYAGQGALEIGPGYTSGYLYEQRDVLAVGLGQNGLQVIAESSGWYGAHYRQIQNPDILFTITRIKVLTSPSGRQWDPTLYSVNLSQAGINWLQGRIGQD